LIQFIIAEFRKENLSHLLHLALLKALDISFCTAEVTDYLWVLTQLLNPAIVCSEAVRKTLIDNYVAIMNAKPPMPLNSMRKYFSHAEVCFIRTSFDSLLFLAGGISQSLGKDVDESSSILHKFDRQ
jgi:hypothetical protein